MDEEYDVIVLGTGLKVSKHGCILIHTSQRCQIRSSNAL